MTGILGILGTVLFVVRIGQMGKKWYLKKKYGPTLAEIEKKYRAKGIAFVAVNVSATETVEKMKEQLAEWTKQGWGGRYAADRDQTIGKLLAVRSTTEVFVVDRARTLVYRGAIDDQYGLGYSLSEARRHYLASALDAVLAEDKPAISATSAPGCALSLGDRPQTVSALTYHNRISRIVQSNCIECHRAGENAPFELASYSDVKEHATMIKKVVGKRTMPPWFGSCASFCGWLSLCFSSYGPATFFERCIITYRPWGLDSL